MDMQTKEEVDRLLKHTPLFKGKWATLESIVVDARTGEKGRLLLRPHSVTELAAILGRYPVLKKLFNRGTRGAGEIDWVDAVAIAGKPALVALISQNVGRWQDQKFESFVSALPDEDFIEILATWYEATMPEGPQDFLLRLARYGRRLGIVSEDNLARIEESLKKGTQTISSKLSQQVESLASSISTSASPTTPSEDDTPTTRSRSSSPSAQNSNSEDAEPTLGL
jgi:hypothetical protein